VFIAVITAAAQPPPEKGKTPDQGAKKAVDAKGKTGAVACPTHPLDGRTFVFVANGSGGGTSMGDTLRDISEESRNGLIVINVNWSRKGSVPGDHWDSEGQLLAAARLADRIQIMRAYCPHSRFIVIGYSSGTRVAIAAAETLPPGTLDRLVLLASSVSAYYDLQRAQIGTCGGIDSFFSTEDNVLALAEDNYGTADGQKGPMAGRIGFRSACGPQCGVRQYRWRPAYGGEGDHTYWARPLFIQNTLVQMLLTPACPPCTGAGCADKGKAPPPPPTAKEPPLASAGKK
jgi:pimeloyl-ACP methyl ester carboxylesterase